jgi:hypothetical protein
MFCRGPIPTLPSGDKPLEVGASCDCKVGRYARRQSQHLLTIVPVLRPPLDIVTKFLRHAPCFPCPCRRQTP